MSARFRLVSLASISLALLASASPALAFNDECTTATPVTAGMTPFDTTGATLSPEPWNCAASSANDLWYSYVAPATGMVTVETCGSAYDTALEVYSGTCGALVLIQCNDDACGLSSRISFGASSGTTYYIRVGGFSSSSGTGTLTVNDPPLPLSGVDLYFGEDLGISRGTPLPSSPNSDGARTNFLSGLGGVGTEDFESFAPSTGAPLPVTFASSGTATLQGNGAVRNVPPGTTNGFGRYAVSGAQFWEVTQVFSIDFSSPQAAFGFYGIDIGDFGGQVTLTLHFAAGGSSVVTIPNTVNGSGGGILYFGLIATDPNRVFTSIDFGNTAAGTDVFAFDDFTIGTLGQVGLGTPICSPAVPNSTGQPGIISATGSDVAAVNDVHLFANQLPPNSNGFFFTSRETNHVVMPGNSMGNICIASFAIGRYDSNILNSGPQGSVDLPIDLTQTPLQPGGPVPILGGQTWYWQYWYRDMSPTGAPTNNFTNATCITFQ